MGCGHVLIDESEGSRGRSFEWVYMPRKGSVRPGDCRLNCPRRAWKLGRCQEFESWRGCENESVSGMVYVTRAVYVGRVRVGSQIGWVVWRAQDIWLGGVRSALKEGA